MVIGADSIRQRTLETVLEATFDGAYLVDQDRRIQSWNEGATLLTGYSAEEVVGRYCSDNILVHVDARGTNLCLNGCPLQKSLDDGRTRRASVFLRHKLGYRVPVSVRVVPILGEDGKVAGAVELFRTAPEPEYWKIRMAELETLAFVDSVTGIPNRRFLESQLDHLLQQEHSAGTPFVACMLDVDHFKLVNDRHGHQIGDRLLHMIGQTLLNCSRAVDVLGRWGGDEFLLLLPRTTLEQTAPILERMCALVSHTGVQTETCRVNATISIGATAVVQNEETGKLLRRVDDRLYQAKEGGRNRCCLE